MKPLHLELVGLKTQLAMMRLGWGKAAAASIFIAGLVSWVCAIPYLRTQLEERQKLLEQTKASLKSESNAAPATHRSVAEERLASFYSALGEKEYAEQQVKTLFAAAGKVSLVLDHAEYKLAFDKNGRFHVYQVNLPVKGTYETIRLFCEQVLLSIPFASLDEISFKRDAIGNRMLEAKLRFTLYLADPSARNQLAIAMKDAAP